MRPTIIAFGESHLLALHRAHDLAPRSYSFDLDPFILLAGLYDLGYAETADGIVWDERLEKNLRHLFATRNVPFVITSVFGRAWHARATFNGERPFDLFFPGHMDPVDDQPREIIPFQMMVAQARRDIEWKNVYPAFLRGLTNKPLVEMLPPPPVDFSAFDDAASIFAPEHAAIVRSVGICPPALRIKVWHAYAEAVRAICREQDIEVIDYPVGSTKPNGLLRDNLASGDAVHANNDYGALLLEQIETRLTGRTTRTRRREEHPYTNAAAHRMWRRAVALPDMRDVDPVVSAPFSVTPTDRIATAGSCFAQHLSRHIDKSGYTYLVTEAAHPMLDRTLASEYNYGTFSARFGNIYTTRQLLQLFQRAYGEFTPIADFWTEPDGTVLDPFRPQVQPGGFADASVLAADRAHHFRAVRRMVEELDVFVFTLGLTEAWVDRRDGAVYPVCPGVSGGVFDPTLHAFANFTVAEIQDDLARAIAFLRERNPNCRVLLTVSPVPLVATAEDRHVLVATTYSKSCLRVVCEDVTKQFDRVAYFPSYEIITGNYTRGRYFAEDLRSVTEDGVGHVMRLFMQHYAGDATTPVQTGQDEATRMREAESKALVENFVKTICDEEALDRAAAD